MLYNTYCCHLYFEIEENSVFSTGGIASWKLALGTKAGFDSG